MPEPKRSSHPARVNWSEEHKIVVLTDGTNTVAQLLVRDDETRWEFIAEGRARRRTSKKGGEPRDDVIGSRLALSRMFQAAADKMTSELAKYHNMDADGHDLGVRPPEQGMAMPPEIMQAFRDAGLPGF